MLDWRKRILSGSTTSDDLNLFDSWGLTKKITRSCKFRSSPVKPFLFSFRFQQRLSLEIKASKCQLWMRVTNNKWRNEIQSFRIILFWGTELLIQGTDCKGISIKKIPISIFKNNTCNWKSRDEAVLANICWKLGTHWGNWIRYKRVYPRIIITVVVRAAQVTIIVFWSTHFPGRCSR